MLNAFVLLSILGTPACGESLGLLKMEAAFGKLEINPGNPAIETLYLRHGTNLGTESLLAKTAELPFAHGAYSYVLGVDGMRYESRLLAPDRAYLSRLGGYPVINIEGVKIASSDSEGLVAIENWRIFTSSQGRELHWAIRRKWTKDFVEKLSGSPAFFTNFSDPIHQRNALTSTIWYDPLRIAASPASSFYELPGLAGFSRKISENVIQTIKDERAWVILKLWTNWHEPIDLRLSSRRGFIYRRGSYSRLGEFGITDVSKAGSIHHSVGEEQNFELKISGVDKRLTGYQLNLHIPDPSLEVALKDLYTSLLNGGAINDQKGFDFGNESDGWYYAGSSWFQALAIGAGVPADGPLSSHPFSVSAAFREHLAHILATVDSGGLTHFGYNQSGKTLDDNLYTILAAREYLVHTGDTGFIRQGLGTYQRMLEYFLSRRNNLGLFALPEAGPYWYYDSIVTSNVSSYYNALLYKAITDLAEMEAACGFAQKSQVYSGQAASLKSAFNFVLWRKDASGGSRYVDWIDSDGSDVTYFCDICQYAPIVFNIASRSQARKIIQTADARLAVLRRDFDYQETASLSALWPVPEKYKAAYAGPQPFGTYMNGGSLLASTYWEIVARSRAGDFWGALRRLDKFAQNARDTSWVGDNAFSMSGEPHGDKEAYLADMVVVSAAAINGLLGVDSSWQSIAIESPLLPKQWRSSEAKIVYKGRIVDISYSPLGFRIRTLQRVIFPAHTWQMDSDLSSVNGSQARIDGLKFVGAYPDLLTLKSTCDSPQIGGSYISPIYDWGKLELPTSFELAVDTNGGRVAAVIEGSNDGFRTGFEQGRIVAHDGVNSYLLKNFGSSRQTRVRLQLTCRARGNPAPVVDGFRITATDANLAPRDK